MTDQEERLWDFFGEIAWLTLNHGERSGDAVVYPDDLEKAMNRVEPEWWKLAKRPANPTTDEPQG